MSETKKKTENAEIGPVKGRPMLNWVGKRALSRVDSFPAQLTETYSDNGAPLGSEGSGAWQSWPKEYPEGGLLFYGDNKEVLANLLTTGFRGKVNLIYIDPPFDSAADYVRRVQLRGKNGAEKLAGESYSLGEQVQYTDIWANDNYLQFMYERLILLKELLAENGSIYIHLDWHRVHLVRCVMDEIFGSELLQNEVIWAYKTQGASKTRFSRKHDTILFYTKSQEWVFNYETERSYMKHTYGFNKEDFKVDEEGRQYRDAIVRDVWEIDAIQTATSENIGFPTQKPERLLERIVRCSSNPGDIVLDCFIGSGTTAAVAQKLGRRWIGCDINKGAIQTTSKRLQKAIGEQVSEARKPQQNGLEDAGDESPAAAQTSFATYRVNDYDLAIQHNEAASLACEHIGIDRTRTDSFFDGTLGTGTRQELVKIVPFDHPLGVHDLEEVKRELEARQGEETRGILLVCLGKELQADRWLEEWNKHRGITSLDELNRPLEFANKLRVIELRTDQQYGKFFIHQPARADVRAERKNGKVRVEVEDFISPTIVERLGMDAGDASMFKAEITDWRSMVDSVMIDPDYDGETLNVAIYDVPESKNDLVQGTYELPAPNSEGGLTVAVKLTDMLGEEVFVTQTLDANPS